MIRPVFISSFASIVFVILQSVFFSKIMPFNIVPDIALIILVAVSWRYGSLTGEISGFFAGACFDVLGLAPAGFHTFLYTLIAYLFGRMYHSLSPGPFFLPVLATIVATLIKYGGSFLLTMIFESKSGFIHFFSLKTLWELGINACFAPLVFFLVYLFARFLEKRRGGFN